MFYFIIGIIYTHYFAIKLYLDGFSISSLIGLFIFFGTLYQHGFILSAEHWAVKRNYFITVICISYLLIIIKYTKTYPVNY